MAKDNIEMEVRFFYPSTKLNVLHKKVQDRGSKFEGRFYELTVMYDNPNDKYSFYKEEIDGRLRFRTSKYAPIGSQDSENHKMNDSSRITWKRRLPIAQDSNVNKEEEVEVEVSYDSYKNMLFIFENVLKCKRISSYERYRSIYKDKKLSITIDEFPYGMMLEVEVDSGTEQDLIEFLKQLGLSLNDASRLSCDDKYVELCNEAGVAIKNDILFADQDMPQIHSS